MDKKYPFVVIGGGVSGLSAALGLAKAGKKVLVIKDNCGESSANSSGILSKALLEVSRKVKHFPDLQKGGIALKLVREIIAGIRQKEDSKALQALGIQTLKAKAYFLSKNRLALAAEDLEVHVQADQIVIAAGSSPFIPKIPGLEQTPYLTNETVFSLPAVPESLCVIGGGSFGSELAQAFSNLGTRVVQIHSGHQLIDKEEPEAAAIILETFENLGIEVHLNDVPRKITYPDGMFHVELEEKVIQTTHLLVAAGQIPNISDLQLDNAEVKYSAKGIPTDVYGRSNQKHIWVVGDAMGQEQFAHFTKNRAKEVLLNLIHPFNFKWDRKQAIPRVTYTDPEVASFGMLEKEAIEILSKKHIKVLYVPFTEVDSAITAGREEGFVKVITEKDSGQILGATIVGPCAGEMLPELSLAAYCKISIKKIGKLIHPYPTYNNAIHKAAEIWKKEVFIPKLKQPFPFVLWKRYFPIILIALLMFFLYFSGAHKYLTYEEFSMRHEQLKTFVENRPFSTPFLFMGIYILATAASLPGGAFLSLLGGFLFPLPFSTLYVLIGATIGACCPFLAAKTALGDSVRCSAGPLVKKMEAGFQENAWSYLLFLRLVPIFPFWLVNLAPALFGVPFITFLWTTFVGIIPGAYVFTQAGAGLSMIFESKKPFALDTIFNTEIKVALVVLGLFSLMPVVIKKIFKTKGG